MRILLLLLVSASPVLAQETVHLTLQQAVETALRQNPAVLTARIAMEAADARIKQARSDYFPQIGFNGIAKAGLSGATNQLGLVGLPNSPFYRNLADSLNVYQSGLDFGRREDRIAYERRQREALEADFRKTEALVTLQVERAFYNLLRTQRLREVAAEVLRSRELTLRQAQAFYDAQIRSRVDLELARVGHSQAQLQLLHAENRVRIAAAELGRALGASQDATYIPEQPALSLPQLEPLNSLIEEALQKRPDLRSLQAEREAAAEKVKLARDQRKPLLSLVFSGGYARFTNILARELLAGGAGLVLPLFTGGRLEGQVEEAQAQLRVLESREEELKQRISFEVRNSYLQLQNTLEAIPVLRAEADSSRLAVRLASERYQERIGDLVELNQAQTNLAEASADEATGLYEVKVADSELKFAVGR